jgi:hypothetical protein
MNSGRSLAGAGAADRTAMIGKSSDHRVARAFGVIVPPPWVREEEKNIVD